MWLIYALLSAVSASLVAIFAKIGLGGVDTTLATTARTFIMFAFFVLTSLFLKKFEGFSLASIYSKEWMFIILSGLAGAISYVFYFLALKYGLANKVAVIDRLSFVFVIILAAIFLGESIGWKIIIGSVLMIVGALIIVLQ
jgi:transporter family protein